MSAIIFGSGFGGITDIETGPDGSLYILSYDEGIIYKISVTRSNKIDRFTAKSSFFALPSTEIIGQDSRPCY